MPDYKQAQCIAFCIKPGGTGNGAVYIGDATSEKDIRKRCEIMKAAVATAYRMVTPRLRRIYVALGGGGNIRGVDPVLKIFMAPEFFFRGKDGAYPIDKIHAIVPEMAKETRQRKYKDWLFVYGTAVGYQDRDETITKVQSTSVQEGKTLVQVDHLSEDAVGWFAQEYAKTKVTGVEDRGERKFRLTLDTQERFTDEDTVTFVHGADADRTEVFDIVDSDDEGPDDRTRITIEEPLTPIETEWVAEVRVSDPVQVLGQEVYAFDVEKVRTLDHDQRVEVTLTTEYGVPSGKSVRFLRQPDFTSTPSYLVLNAGSEGGHATITVRYPGQERLEACPSCECKSFEPAPNTPEICINCLHTHAVDSIRKGWKVDAGSRGLLLNTGEPLTPGHFMSLTRAKADERTEVFNMALVQQGGAKAGKELLVYKQTFSGSDFIKGAAKYQMHGEDRWLVNTEPSSTRTSEESASGLGGESVFTVENCTIGLEICLDHRKNRLAEYYDTRGGVKPQIHLIPSMGMSIGGGRVCCRDRGIIFNVDGDRGDSAVRILDAKYRCEQHAKWVRDSDEHCPECMQYRCSTCGNFDYTPDGTAHHPCTNCGNNTLVPFYFCDCGGWRPDAGDCPKCGKALTQENHKKLKQIGATVDASSGPDIVELPEWDKRGDTQTKFFQGKGKIVVYPSKPIPDA